MKIGQGLDRYNPATAVHAFAAAVRYAVESLCIESDGDATDQPLEAFLRDFERNLDHV